MNTKTYLVSYGDLSFGAAIRKPKKVLKTDSQQYHIQFGGKEKCIDITVYKNEPKAWLTGLRHDKLCVMNETLPEGNSGTVLMVCAAILFTIHNYPYVSSLEFLDKSQLKCKLKTKIPLDSYYFAKHGKTWYESKFGARPAYEPYIRSMEMLNVFLDSSAEKAKYAFESFYKERVFVHVKKHYEDMKHISYDAKDKYIGQLKQIMCPLFNETSTFREFIKKIDESHPQNCIIYFGWLNTFLTQAGNIPFQGMNWIIDKSCVPKNSVIKVKPYEKTLFVQKHDKFDFMTSLPPQHGGIKNIF